MDLTLLWLTLVLLIGGFALVVLGERMKPTPADAAEAAAPSWGELVRSALGNVVRGIGQISNGPSLGHRVQGIGSALLGIGVIVLLAWVLVEVLPELTNGGDGGADASPSPSA